MLAVPATVSVQLQLVGALDHALEAVDKFVLEWSCQGSLQVQQSRCMIWVSV